MLASLQHPAPAHVIPLRLGTCSVSTAASAAARRRPCAVFFSSSSSFLMCWSAAAPLWCSTPIALVAAAASLAAKRTCKSPNAFVRCAASACRRLTYDAKRVCSNTSRLVAAGPGRRRFPQAPTDGTQASLLLFSCPCKRRWYLARRNQMVATPGPQRRPLPWKPSAVDTWSQHLRAELPLSKHAAMTKSPETSHAPAFVHVQHLRVLLLQLLVHHFFLAARL